MARRRPQEAARLAVTGEPEVRAAGGVVVRGAPAPAPGTGAGAAGSPPPDGAEVAVIHRPRYDDWTIPKGKLNEGEMGKLAVFAGVHKFPARVKCAILPWHAVVAAMEGRQEPVTTESEQI